MDEADQGGVGSPAQSVSFCGWGFIFGYELGVIQALQELAPEMLGSAAKFFGISSGAIAAAVLACGGNKEIVDEIYSEAMEKSKKSLLGPYSPRFHFLKLLEKGLRKGLTENCHQLASGRLHIGLTRLPDGQKVVISDFCSKEEVIQNIREMQNKGYRDTIYYLQMKNAQENRNLSGLLHALAEFFFRVSGITSNIYKKYILQKSSED